METDFETLQCIAGNGENLAEMPFIGIPFFRTDHVKDWQNVDIRLIGVATDAGLSHRPGTHYGPQAVWAQSGLIPLQTACQKAWTASDIVKKSLCDPYSVLIGSLSWR